MANDLDPALLEVLAAIDRGEVRIARLGPLGQRRIWVANGRPNTPAVQSLLDSGLAEEDRECLPPIALTDKGRALLDGPGRAL